MAAPLSPNPARSDEPAVLEPVVAVLPSGRKVRVGYRLQCKTGLSTRDIEDLWHWLLQQWIEKTGLKLDERSYIKFCGCLSEALTDNSFDGLVWWLGEAYQAATGRRPTTSSWAFDAAADDDRAVIETRSGLFVQFVQRVVRRSNSSISDPDVPSGFAIAEALQRMGGGDYLLRRISDLLSLIPVKDKASKELAQTLGISIRTLRHWLNVAKGLKPRTAAGTVGVDHLLKALILDLRKVFKNQPAERLSSETIVCRLAAIPDRPWASWRAGRALRTQELATLLKPLCIKPVQKTMTPRTVSRGYEREAFADKEPYEAP